MDGYRSFPRNVSKYEVNMNPGRLEKLTTADRKGKENG